MGEMKKISRWGLGFLIALSLGLNFYLLQKVKIFKRNENAFEVVKVLDGDSFVIPPLNIALAKKQRKIWKN